MLNKLLNNINNNSDYLIKKININNNILYIICIETITSSSLINDFLLKHLSTLSNYNENNLIEYLYNYIPSISINKLNNYQDIESKLLSGFTIIFINDKVLSIETKDSLARSISESSVEKSIIGPKDSFIENFNTNVGLIRKRIKSNNLVVKSINIGRFTNTKIGILYIDNIVKIDLVNKIINKLKQINNDSILDSGHLCNLIKEKKYLFPTIKRTEKPDLASFNLLEGKVVIIVDNSPDVLIIPSFFIDYFHTSDDYYQKEINISFIRILRLIAFILAIFLPSIYVSVTTHNIDSLPINLLINFVIQRELVPFPAFIEAIIMIISFEILKESDMRIPSTIGTSISILGGLVLGEAAVEAGLVSPIMIIVIAISAISSLVFQSIELGNAIRLWRFIILIISSLFGLYGLFIGIILFLISLSEITSFNKDYLYPFAPINLSEQLDGFIIKRTKIRRRNPLLSNNKIRGIE